MKVKDHFLSEETFEIIPTEIAGIFKTTPLPDDLSKYYESDKYISHHQDSGSLKEIIYKRLQQFNLNYKRNIIAAYVPNKGKILDYGCGAGEFLKYIENDFSTVGFEPNTKALESAKRKTTRSTFLDDVSDAPDDSLDAVTMWHVLEHIYNRDEMLELFYRKLKKGGHLIIAVPNPKSYDAKFYKEHWAAYDVPRHVFHFTQSGMKNIFNNEKWKLENVKPLMLDSFYISMLSEKYKKSPIFWLKGMIRGAISNFKAAKNGEFSSLVYVVVRN